MALTKCKECKKEVSTSAKRVPTVVLKIRGLVQNRSLADALS
ncbi:Uncharacterised protein [Salmonella enterica]|nr:Uncharacterised protein [Salmonella enterica]